MNFSHSSVTLQRELSVSSEGNDRSMIALRADTNLSEINRFNRFCASPVPPATARPTITLQADVTPLCHFPSTEHTFRVVYQHQAAAGCFVAAQRL